MGEMGGACSTHGETRNACRMLVGKPEGKTHLGRLRRRWMILKRIIGIWICRSWIRFIWLRIETSGGLLWARQ
jgi:hypothetical protein